MSKHTPVRRTSPAARLLRSRRRHARYLRVLALAALFVAAGTAFVLRVSGITLTKTETVLDCQYDGHGAHTHDPSCYDADGNLVCPLEERPLHVHTPECYATERVLACGLEETDGHQHGDECYDEEGNLTCAIPVGEGAHRHTDECYQDVQTDELTCGLEEATEQHVHTDACFRTVTIEEPDPEPEPMATEPAPAADPEPEADEPELVPAADPELSDPEPAVDSDPQPAEPETVDSTTPAEPETVDPQTANDPAAGQDPANPAEPAAPTFPKQNFDKRFLDAEENEVLRVDVEAPEGALPEGTTMVAEWVDPASVQRPVERVVAAKDATREVWYVQGVRITFYDRDGKRVQPTAGSRVTITVTSSLVDTAEDATVRPYVLRLQDDLHKVITTEEEDAARPAEVLERLTDEQLAAREVSLSNNQLAFDAQYFCSDDFAESYLVAYTTERAQEPAADETADDQGEPADDQGDAEDEGAPADDQAGDADEGQDPEDEGEPADDQADNPGDEQDPEDEDEDEANDPEDAEPSYPAQSFKHRFSNHDGSLVLRVAVDAPEGAFPKDTTMKVTWLDPSTVEGAVADAVAQEAQDKEVAAVQAVDITFLDAQGNEVEPLVPVTVTLTPGEESVPEEAEGQLVVHVDDAGAGEVVAQLSEEELAEREIDASDDQLVFDADAFSVYAVVYTVDFHYEANGKTYGFTLPGGGFVSLEHLVEVLGIASSADAESPEAEMAANAASNQEDTVLSLNDVEVSEETRKFVADVESVTFSNPELVWVGKAESESTVENLKNENALEVQYSAELTEKQIAEINAQTVEAGDWALISVKPFVSEESLTVTMKNGDQFVVRVTDAQISTHVITADGEDFIITVTYNDDAQIPEGATLEADEIAPESDAYKEYLAQAQAAIDAEAQLKNDGEPVQDAAEAAEDESGEVGDLVEMTESTDIEFARFFDIRIMANGKKIEPAAPVKVTVTYADALQVSDDSELLAVHFAEKGTEVIEASANEEGKSVVFMQDSFSVTGTVVTVGQNAWPASDNKYVLFTEIDGQYYAINHDGELIAVTRNGNQLSFDDADVLFHGMDEYLWTYQQRSNIFSTTYTLFYNVAETSYWLNPADEGGIGNNRSLDRTNNTVKVSNGDYYLTANADHTHIAGQGNADNAIPIYFANGFNNVNKVIVHFVDRNGAPISGVTYDGTNSNVVANPSGDGTFAIRYDWGGATGVVDLSEDFLKTGYTYASTHLAGVQAGTTLKQDGLTIDAKLTERDNRHLYIGADIGSNADYLPYANDAIDRSEGSIQNYSGQRRLDQTIRAAAISTNARQDYATTTDKDIYVILDPAPNTIPAGGDTPTDVDADDPKFTKTLEDNEDGTYTLSLTIEGHANSVNKSTNANVLFIVDTSSSMNGAVGNSTRIGVTHDALKRLGDDLMHYNDAIPGRVEVSMLAFDGAVYNRLGWTDDKDEFDEAVDEYIRYYYLHRGTDWEDALKAALTQAASADDEPTFVIFFTDGEPSQYSNYHGANTFNWNNEQVSPAYGFYFNSFLSRESSNDEARALVDSGYQLYGVFAFNDSGHTYPNGVQGDESDSDLLHNLLKYGYNTDKNLGAGSTYQRFFPASNQEQLEAAFDKILESINIRVGFDQVTVTDNITDMTQAGFATSFDAVNHFTYYRKGNGYGTEWQEWQDAPLATPNVQDNSVAWELKNSDGTPMVLEDGVSYKVSFVVWPKQQDFDWVANLQNGTKTWDDVEAAGLDYPNGANPQVVRTNIGTEENPVYTYSIATNKPSTDGNGTIINNRISYRKVRTEILKALPEGVSTDTEYETQDGSGNTVITTYTNNNGVITKTVVTYKNTYFNPPEPMPLNETKMQVKKEWEDSINLGHRADHVIFNLLVDGEPYMDKAAQGEEAKEYDIRVEDSSGWVNEVVIAPGVIRGGDILEEGHSYTISEEYEAEGSDFYGFSFEFKSQTVRPMNIDGELVYLVEIDDDNPAPDGATIHAIAGRSYYAVAEDSGQRYYEAEKDSTGKAAISGTNGKTSELDITKIINAENTNLTASDLNAETFTYRITLNIPAGSNVDGIMGYCYFEYPDGPNEPFTLYGYQPGETALASDIERFGGKKIYRSWNTTNNRIESQLMTTNDDGSITIQMDLTLTQKEVLRLTNLPSGTEYTIEEVYANYYAPASPGHAEEGQVPSTDPSNLSEQGYSVTQIVEKNSNQTEEEKSTHTGVTIISGTISETNTRYYNQFTNELTDLALGELKVTKHLDGYEWSGQKYYFNLTAGAATYSDGTGVSPMPASNRIYLSNPSGTEDKTYTFGKIRYQRPGTYQYTITETDAEGNVLSGTIGDNIAYAPAETVTVTVDYGNDGHLVVTKIEGSNGNTVWSSVDSSAVVAGTTTCTNRLVVSVPIKKMDANKQKQLSNAVFELKSGPAKLFFDSSNTVLTAAQVETIIGMSVTADGAAAAMANAGITSTFTIGEITLNGLWLNTTYTLKEINPPDGYLITEGEATFTLSKDNEGTKITVTGENISVDEDGISLIITNTPGTALPEAGGIGTHVVYLIGLAVMGFGVAGLIRSRKREALA